MWRDRNRYPEHNYVPDTFWLLVATLLFAVCGLVWLIGQVAAILFGAHEHLPVRLVDMLGVLLRLPGTWDDPARAWPPSSQPLLPGPVGMYAAAVLTFWLPALAYGLLVRLVSPRARRRRRQRGARWASWWQLRRLLVLGPKRGRIILGRRDRLRDRLLGRLYLAVEQCHSVLAFGPPGSFKTHGLVIPAILEWQGNLVTTSIKPDVLRATCAHRANLGAVWVYDPLGLSGVPGARWTPLAIAAPMPTPGGSGACSPTRPTSKGTALRMPTTGSCWGPSCCRSCCLPPPGPDGRWPTWPAGWTSRTWTTWRPR
jgi:type IV secretion system protein VirD4